MKAEGKSLPVGEAMPRAELRTVDPVLPRGEHFAREGTRVRRDRWAWSGKVVIINQTLADKFFPNEDRRKQLDCVDGQDCCD